MAQVDFRDKEALLSQFDVMATPFFEVIAEKKRKFIHIEDDMEGAKEFLRNQLDAIGHFGSTSIFTIIYYSEVSDKGKLMQDAIIGSNTFKLNEGELSSWKGYGSRNQDLEEIKEILKAQQSQITALMQEPDENDEDEPEPEKLSGLGSIAGMLSGLLSQPEVQQVIAQKIVGFINGIFPEKNALNMNTQQGVIGNVQQDDSSLITQSLERLFAAGMTAQDFKKLADLTNNPQQFQMYLSMLRG